MNKFIKTLAILIMLVLVSSGCSPAVTPTPEQNTKTDWLPVEQSVSTFSKSNSIRQFSFPADHGSHPDFQTEWWYFTGNLKSEEGRRFGYELTFFRRGLTPDPIIRDSDWATDNIYMAHFAITDANGNHFQAVERFSRDGNSLAGAEGTPFSNIWLNNWYAKQTDASEWELSAKNEEMSIDLQMTDMKGPVLQGEQGISRKSAENASYYYSLTRLMSNGTIGVDGKEYVVSGESWMDHEFSTSALAPDQIGWDWFALQLDDGSDLMLFTLRRSDGTIDPYSIASLIRPDGKIQSLSSNEFSIDVNGSWISPHSNAKYPSGWAISIPSQKIKLTVIPLIKDQELNLSFIYWEGAVRVEGMVAGQQVSGFGYVELTGYAQSMQGQF